MCGIIGIISKKEFTSKKVLELLKRVEYRGYDSYGYHNGKRSVKKVGKITIHDDQEPTRTAIAHTRWATHGRVSEKNSHPHTQGRVTIVHNGIIENHEELREELKRKGRELYSETDTEIIAALLDEELNKRSREAEEEKRTITNKEVISAINNVKKKLRGTYAVVFMIKEENKEENKRENKREGKRGGEEENEEGKKRKKRLFCFKNKSPLIIGVGEEEVIIASDAYSFSKITNKVIILDDGDEAIIEEDGGELKITTTNNQEPVIKEEKILLWDEEEDEKNHEHYMIKEIREEPEKARKIIKSLNQEQREELNKITKILSKAEEIIITGSGTAYNAGLIGAKLLRKKGKKVRTIIASEFSEEKETIPENSVLVVISQSGETMDVIEAMRLFKNQNSNNNQEIERKIIAITNTPYSTIERQSNHYIRIKAGPEIAVASTKAYINQVITMMIIAEEMTNNQEEQEMKKHQEKEIIKNLLTVIDKTCEKEPEIEQIAEELTGKKDLYIIGRGLATEVTKEIALKIKEVAYTHAEGMIAGELKHGTIALIEEGTPVIGLVYNNDEKMNSSLEEVKSRGAMIIRIGTTTNDDITIPAKDELSFMIGAVIVGQLIAYHTARKNNLPIDQPRNLAKSVTVF